MVSKEFFEFISSHCGNVVAWLLVLLPFFHLTFIIGRFICYLFREYKIVSQVIGHDSDTPLWMVAFELSCMDIYPSIMLYALLSMFYFDVKLGAILTMVSVIVFLIFLLDKAVTAKKDVGLSLFWFIIFINAIEYIRNRYSSSKRTMRASKFHAKVFAVFDF